MFFYYSRISTSLQNPSRQIENFKTHGHVNAENVYVDKIQGNIPFFQRPEAVKLFEKITSFDGDEKTIVIDSIDRLGRNLVDILKTIDVFTANQINMKSIKEGFQTMVNNQANPVAQMTISVMGSLAEMERNKIKERQAEGILIAKAQGKFKGRKLGSIQTDARLLRRYPIVVQKLKKGLSIRDVSEITSNSTATIMKVKRALATIERSDIKLTVKMKETVKA